MKIINRFLNNKRIPAIPPLLVNGEIISNFSQKASVFNKFFMFQCSSLQNSSGLPTFYLRTDETLSSTFYLRTDETLSSLNINDDEIFAIINNINPNKSYGFHIHGYPMDNISIRMIKFCGKPIAHPLILILEASLQDGEFPDYWEKRK